MWKIISEVHVTRINTDRVTFHWNAVIIVLFLYLWTVWCQGIPHQENLHVSLAHTFRCTAVWKMLRHLFKNLSPRLHYFVWTLKIRDFEPQIDFYEIQNPRLFPGTPRFWDSLRFCQEPVFFRDHSIALLDALGKLLWTDWPCYCLIRTMNNGALLLIYSWK